MVKIGSDIFSILGNRLLIVAPILHITYNYYNNKIFVMQVIMLDRGLDSLLINLWEWVKWALHQEFRLKN